MTCRIKNKFPSHPTAFLLKYEGNKRKMQTEIDYQKEPLIISTCLLGLSKRKRKRHKETKATRTLLSAPGVYLTEECVK